MESRKKSRFLKRNSSNNKKLYRTKKKEVALIENIQREDLNPIEKAKALKEIIEKYGMTQQELANKLGISRSGIANTMRIF